MNTLSPWLAADEARVATLPQLWRRRCALWGERPALRHKERGIWQGLRWSDYFADARAIGLALAEAGMERGDVVSILSDNRPQWLVADMAAQAMGYVSHGIYPCSTTVRVRHVLSEAGSRVVIVENAAQLTKVLEVRDACPDLEHIVVIDTRGLRRFADPQVGSYEEWRRRGHAAAARDPSLFDQRIDAGAGDQVAFLASTAGSTGAPRLVAVRHESLLQDVRLVRPWLPLQPRDRALSIVSLAHHGERLLATKALLMHEGLLHFPENAATVFNDMVEVAPHWVHGPPRLFEKLQSLTELFMMDAIPVARASYAAALSAARANWWHRRMRERIRAALGLNKVRVAFSSGAASPAPLVDWFAAIGVPLSDCYALTEAGFCTDAQMTLAPDGEILVRGAQLRCGYWVRGEIVHPPTDGNGWLRTGDLGSVDRQGRMRLLGRVVNRFSGPQGEAIHPEIAEDALRLSAYVADAVVAPGEDGRLAAVLALDEERVRKHAQQHLLPFTDYASLLQLAEIDSLIAAQVEIANGRLPENHRVRSVRVIPRPLHPGDEELTPAMRLNRPIVARRYAELKPTGVLP